MHNIKALAYNIVTTFENINDNDYENIISGAYRFLETFEQRKLNNGLKGTLKRYKSLYSGAKAHVLQQESKELDPFIKTNKQGIPKELIPIKDYLFGESPGIRVIMTVLRIFESIKLETELDTKSITDEYNGKPLDPICQEFYLFVTNGLSRYGRKIISLLQLHNLGSQELSFRFKAGPNGPSIITSHLDALALKIFDISENYIKYCQMTNSFSLVKEYEKNLDMCHLDDNSKHKLRIGRISLASEPGGKTRLFAICNFGIQSALKPLHDQLMLSLKCFKTDGTFDQISQFKRITKKSYGHKTFCFDLSKATDRFPIKLQIVLLSAIVNENFAHMGSKLIADFPFTYEDKSYIGKVGQPLGAFSSGAMFALTHHLVVQYCHFKAYKRIIGFEKYGLLGDDIVIGDSKVAKEYQNFMSDIGVEINLSKSVLGSKSNHVGEFAKRLFYNKRNISGFGYSMIHRSLNDHVSGNRFLEILEMEEFLEQDGSLLFPGNDPKGLPKGFISKVVGCGTLRKAFARQIIISDGNNCFSYDNLMEHYVLQRISLLYKQTSSYPNRSQYLKIVKLINTRSSVFGVTVRQNCLDINFINEELYSHPIVSYLNIRNNKIFDKIIEFSEMMDERLFNSEYVLSLASYTQEEYIPSLTFDTFFTNDINSLKFKIKDSLLNKSFTDLMKSVNNL